ncbi:serpin A3-5-like [Falco biarmicus]|uniref:serpin A3-5-like n=1 Tax=Falco cherrug TaxID=345164 RepID=UPI000FFBD2F9|nr:serpin A3-5-like [Falco cherrug]XP_037249865.1 serpin A3-5-like [Falco rusticolus]XP_056201947.1 serpin A3-5-like [Falco biarmicus]
MLLQPVANSVCQFACCFYKEISSRENSGNIFFSPLSISTALAMLTLGARSDTLTQILRVLNFNPREISENEIHEGYRQLIQMVNRKNEGLQLNMGNVLFVLDRLKPQDKFLSNLRNFYEGEAYPMNFKRADQAQIKINEYVAARTNGKIKDLINNLDPLTEILLISYIYFNAEWEKPFDPKYTKKSKFFVNGNKAVEVPMMFGMGIFKHGYDDQLSSTVVQMDYKGGASAFFILPDQGRMKKLEKRLSCERMSRWRTLVSKSSANLYLPKFTLYGTYNLKDILYKMGIMDVFTDKADLSGITGQPQHRISQAIHKAVVKVDETGTEAAAATGMEIVPMSVPATIVFNRPFLMFEKKMKYLLCLCLLLAVLCAVTHCHHEDICHEVKNTNLRTGRESLLAHYCDKQGTNYADFVFRFYKQVISKEADKNVFFSPMSISTAFAILALGAKSTTLSQIFEGLGFDNLTETRIHAIHESFHKVLAVLNCTDANITLNIGNALFTAIGYEPQETFLQNTKQFYDADFFSSNFHKPQEAKKQINTYVKEKTKGKIPELIGHLDPSTALVLVNYIYFKAAWQKSFDPLRTYEDDFFLNTNASVRVNMMQQEGNYESYYDQDLSCEVIELPYQGTARTLFILPDNGKMKQVEDALSKETVCKWDSKLVTRRLVLQLPKFSVSGSYDVKNLFKEMGITDVFSSDADLSGISGSCNLQVSQAIHKALVEVDEAGTEAAGSTAIILNKVFHPPVTIKFNRPFIILISDKETSTTLFIGKIVNPTEK